MNVRGVTDMNDAARDPSASYAKESAKNAKE